MKKIIITGGHLTPAMAVIKALKNQGGWQIYYFGRKYSMEGERTPSVESKLISQLGIPFFSLKAGRFQRRFTRYTLPSFFKIPIGFFQALFLLLRVKPDIILSFGGYISVPVVVAGWLLQIPILTHEQTCVVGLASKINSLFAQRIAVSFKESLDFFPSSKTVLTGNPIREEVFKARKPKDFPSFFFSKKRPPLLYVTGGSQGANVINLTVLRILRPLLEKFALILQCGEKDYRQLLVSRSRLPSSLQKCFFVTKYIDPEEIGWVLKNASLVVSRAGANTVCELAALGKPAILIPIPWSSYNEQLRNAHLLKKWGLAEILPQKKLSGETLFAKIEEAYENLGKYQKAARKAQALVIKDAAQKILKEIEELTKK